VVSFVVYTYNLRELSWFEGDSARDTLRSLQILRNREITTIGPPLSFGLYGMREIYFGSLIYYLGALGLWIFHENVLGPVFVLSAMYIVSTPFFYILTGLFTKKFLHRCVITVCYSLGPITVVHSRFFWNPNFIVPLSVMFWLCMLRSIQLTSASRWRYIFVGLSGLIAALMINLHYSVAVSMLFVMLYLTLKREHKMILSFFLGLIIGLSPLILFELRNNFYLSQAISYNLSHPAPFPTDRPLVMRLIDIGLVVPITLGLHRDHPFDNSIFRLPYIAQWIIGVVSLAIAARVSRRKLYTRNTLVHIAIISSIISSLIFSKDIYSLRYMFATYPIFLIVFMEYVLSFVRKSREYHVFVILVVLSIMFTSSLKVITVPTFVTYAKYRMPSIIDLEHIAKLIAQDHPHMPFNITENITGDSRMLYLRYFVYRDTKGDGLGDPTEYMGLHTLYVLTPSLDKTLEENRWEFRATSNLRLMKQWKIKEYRLLRFDAM
jgi:hypothetical protein